MTTSFASVVSGAKLRADLSTVGLGPHLTDRLSDPEWRSLLNLSILSVWRGAAASRPDFQTASVDFSLVSGGSASFPLPVSFFDEIDVCWMPDTPSEYSLGNFGWANRRSPGGWFPANFGGTANYGGNAIRIMGDNHLDY